MSDVSRNTEADPILAFRVSLRSPDKQLLHDMKDRLTAAGIDVLREGILGIDARGLRSAIEHALGTSIERTNEHYECKPSEISIGNTTSAVVYFPKTPTYYP